MAIVNNTFFRVLISPADSTGASEISNADRVNIIGGGAVDEQGIILENSNHAYSTINRRVLLNVWSGVAPTSSTAGTGAVYKNTSTSFIVGLESPATVGTARQLITAFVHYQGTVKVEVFTPALVSLDSHTFGASAAATTASDTLTWSTTTDVVIKVSLAGITSPSSADGYLWGVRITEAQIVI